MCNTKSVNPLNEIMVSDIIINQLTSHNQNLVGAIHFSLSTYLYVIWPEKTGLICTYNLT